MYHVVRIQKKPDGTWVNNIQQIDNLQGALKRYFSVLAADVDADLEENQCMIIDDDHVWYHQRFVHETNKGADSNE